MLREREIDNENGHRAGQEVFESAGSEGSAESGFDHSKAEPLSDEVARKPSVVVDESANMINEVERERGSKVPGKGKRRIVGAILFLVVAVTGILSFWFISGSGATKKARVAVNKTNGSSQTDDATTRQAIEVVNGNGVALPDGSLVRPQSSPTVSPSQSAASTQPVTELPRTATDLSTTVPDRTTSNTNSSTDAASGPGNSSTAKVLTSGRNGERSVRIGEESVVARREPDSPKRSGDGSKRDEKAGRVPVPSFGSMLPVRSLGVIYSLRSGALARFELTRDVSGKGWSLPHGTVLVGALRGSEHDRAYISLVGFIDADSGKFVQIGGNLLGSDGAEGVRGKRRKMSSSWSKAFKKLATAGLDIAGRAAGSIGNGPVIIRDAYGQTAARFQSEFNGVVQNKDSFIEIVAGTMCYVMITDLRGRVQGVDALANLSRTDLEEKADSDQRRQATGISERELAELLQSGDPARIKAALPRMTADMRRVAEAVIAEGNER
ncbi:MAG: hypothetical protein QOH71_178 [Blastocatellia bacterium]|jgi:cytoskeletal protein RodZ|nr:hypothetical protein [Blastocatellia bacterium]